jgi:hypothetical protein
MCVRVGDPGVLCSPPVPFSSTVPSRRCIAVHAKLDVLLIYQTRFRTIPINELVDGVTISSLSVSGGETVQHCGLGVFEIGY